MSARAWAAQMARVMSGLVVLGATGAVVVGAGALPDAPPEATPSGLVDVAPPRTTLVCAGPLVLPDDAGGSSGFARVPVEPDLQVQALSTATSGGEVAPGTMTLLGGSTPSAELTPGAVAASRLLTDPSGAVLVQAEPVGGAPALLAATSASTVTAGDLRGLAAASCRTPGSEQWLVGGSTEIGSSASLVLLNPGTTPTEVTIELWGPSGQVELAGTDHHLVAPGAQRVVDLAAVAAEQRRLVVRLTTTGGAVSATLQDSALDGFTAAGTDLVVPGAEPATRQVVTGLVVEDSTVDDTVQPVLRLLAPGADGTTARVTLLGTDGPVELPGADTVALAAGEVTDLPLGGLAAGAYTAVVDADVPVVAAGLLTRRGAPGELDPTPTLERAWAAAAEPSTELLAAVPQGTTASVVLARATQDPDGDAGAGSAVLRGYGARGELVAEKAVSLAADRTMVVDVAELGAGVTGVSLTGTEDDAAGWVLALLIEVEQADGTLVSVVTPVAPVEGVTQVPVRRGSALGLG
ncbi:DUF5719 family protein [Cellulomonas sp. P22]|uniref:DUF5719 family protein n=1 Tax=Cellulomonas sp. P22 TaxID=3373189 RepID=UPI003790AA90